MNLHIHCPACDLPIDVEVTLVVDDDENDYSPSICLRPGCNHDLRRECEQVLERALRKAKWHEDPMD